MTNYETEVRPNRPGRHDWVVPVAGEDVDKGVMKLSPA